MQHTWVFQLKNTLQSAQKEAIAELVRAFLQKWQSHGAPVPGEFRLLYDRFLIVKATPDATSGCSIDSMNKSVKEILQNQGCEIMESNYIFYKREDGEIDYADFRELGTLIQSGTISPDTIVFDASMNQSSDLSLWEVPAKATWISRYFDKSSVN